MAKHKKLIIPNRYNKTVYNGKVVSWDIRVALYHAEKKTGYSWDMGQGCFSDGDLSANTHAGAGIIDISDFETERRLRIWKDLGGFGWGRDERDSSDFGDGNEHCHIGLKNCRKMSASAKAQLRDWLLGLNGLANHGRDRYVYRPDPPVAFHYKNAYRQMIMDQEEEKAEKRLDLVKKQSPYYRALVKFTIRYFRSRSKINH